MNRPNRHPWVSAVAAVQLPDAPVLLATSYYRTVRLWDPATGKAVRRGLRPLRFRHDSPVTAFAAVPLEDGRVLLATCEGIWALKVRLWDAATGTPVGALLARDTRAVAAVRLPDGRVLLATGSGDGTVRLWDPATGTPVGDPLTGHTQGVTAVAEMRMPDGRVLLATGSWDETVRLWDLPAGRQLHSLPVRDVVQALAVHGNELTVATRAGLLVLSLANVLQGGQLPASCFQHTHAYAALRGGFVNLISECYGQRGTLNGASSTHVAISGSAGHRARVHDRGAAGRRGHGARSQQ
jgi:WD40 repeat protein